MRRRGKLVFWPAYFESSLTWGQGRRVSKRLSLRGVKAVEVFRAAEDLGLNPLMDEGAAYPKAPWMRSGVRMTVDTGFFLALDPRRCSESTLRAMRAASPETEKPRKVV